MENSVKLAVPIRRKDGIPIPEHEVIAADLLALVAGINFNSAVKFLLAVNAIAESLGVPVAALVDRASIPIDPADPARYRATSDVAEVLVGAPGMQRYEDELHFLHRMSRK